MRFNRLSCAGGALSVSLLAAGAAQAGVVVVDYTVDLGGKNGEPLNGLSGRGTWDINGTTLTITLENTSAGVPNSFDASDQLIVSVGFILQNGNEITNHQSALVGPGSNGLGAWNGRTAGDSVAEEWLWTNEAGGDLMENWSQVISTSSGQDGGDTMRFDGVLNGNVDGPFGGIAHDPPYRNIPANRTAVADSNVFMITLAETLSLSELQKVAGGSIIEFGSDQRYLGVPAPGALSLLILAGMGAKRRRRN